MERLKTIDVLRAIAILIIVLCHYFEDGPLSSCVNLGFYLGNVGNALFFSISALLYGLKFAGGDYAPFVLKDFLIKRVETIFVPLWIFLLVLIPLSLWGGHMSIDISTTLFNIVGLCWIKPLQYAGHLWFITMILVCYGVFYIISNIKRAFSLTLLWLGVVTLLLMLVFYEQFNSASKSLPIVCLLYSSYLFINAKSFVEFSKRICTKGIVIFSILVSLLTLAIFIYLDWQSYMIYTIIIASISALSIVSMSINCSHKFDKLYPYFKEISTLSYYIYIVHLPLERPIYDNIESPIVQIFLLFTLSIILAKFLKYITGKIMSWVI